MTTPLRRALKKRKMTGQQFANEIGANASEISRWCNGTRKPSLANRERINEALGTEVYPLTPDKLNKKCSICGKFAGATHSHNPLVTPQDANEWHEREQAKKR